MDAQQKLVDSDEASKEDLLFVALFQKQHRLLLQLVHLSVERMQVLVPFTEANELLETSTEVYTDCLALFLVLLNVDMDHKKLVCAGIPDANIKPLCSFKAPNIFFNLNESVVMPWMCCEFRSTLDLVETARNHYCIS
jgi:hypothetical protein